MQIVQLIAAGLAQGCIYGLVALGFVLIYKATETVNFAQGEFLMLGAFGGFVLAHVLGLPYWMSVILAVLAVSAVGYLLERTVMQPVMGESVVSIVMLTIGIGYMARGLVTMVPVVGPDTHALPSPVSGMVVRFDGVAISADHILIVVVTIVLYALITLLFQRTKVGIAMQAMSQNQMAAYLMGIPVRRLSGLIWALAACVSAIAGILLAPLTFVHANMGLIAIKAFPAAVIGGFTSLPGAIVGGLIIGLVEQFAGFYMNEGYKNIMPFVVVLLMLIIKPTGLFGERQRKKV